MTTTRSFAPFYGLVQDFFNEILSLKSQTPTDRLVNLEFPLGALCCGLLLWPTGINNKPTTPHPRVLPPTCQAKLQSCIIDASSPLFLTEVGSVIDRAGEASTTIRSECSLDISEQNLRLWTVHTGTYSPLAGPCQCFPSGGRGTRGTNNLVCEQVAECINTERKPIQSECQSPKDEKMGQLQAPKLRRR